MEIVDANEAVLSNFEVLQFLREERANIKSKRKNAAGGQVATLLLETLSSLDSTPASTQTADQVKDFLSRTEEFGLTKSERLMLLNHRPKSELEIHLLVEESEERLNEEQIEKLLGVIREILGGDEEEDEDEVDNDEQQEQQDSAQAIKNGDVKMEDQAENAT